MWAGRVRGRTARQEPDVTSLLPYYYLALAILAPFLLPASLFSCPRVIRGWQCLVAPVPRFVNWFCHGDCDANSVRRATDEISNRDLPR